MEEGDDDDDGIEEEEEDDGRKDTRRSSPSALLGLGVETAAAAAAPSSPLRSRIHSANSSSSSVPHSPPNLSEPSSWSTLLPARAAALFGERLESRREKEKKGESVDGDGWGAICFFFLLLSTILPHLATSDSGRPVPNTMRSNEVGSIGMSPLCRFVVI